MKPFFEKLSKDKSGSILFLLSLSVILITLGIIQTLLFESITFFEQIAENRGWFSLEWNFSGIISSSGLAALILVISIFADHVSRDEDGLISKLPDSLWSVPQVGVRFLLAIALLQFVFLDGLLLNLSILFAFVIWRKIASLQLKRKVGGNIEFTNSWRNVLALFTFVALFDAVTMNYSGALGEFFLQNQWTPTGACADRRSLCDTMSFGVNSLLLTTLQVAFGALLIAVPLGVGTAIYLSEYANPRLVAIVKPTLEILAGIPSVVYGFFAFIYIGPLVVEFGEYAFAEGWIDEPPNVLNPINGAIGSEL